MNSLIRKSLLFVILILIISSVRVFACSSFSINRDERVLLGHNLDFYDGGGLIYVNKRNVAKKGCFYQNRPEWISKYGSITFNQWGRGFPSRGMNEAGLVVVIMELKGTRYPSEDSRPSLTWTQWIQYQLDNCATIEEVLVTDSEIRIEENEYPCHFLVSDKNGNSVTIEWLNGKLVYHKGENLPVAALTNGTYMSCQKFFESNDNADSIDQKSSEARFYKMAEMLKRNDSPGDHSSIDFAFEVLEKVKNPSWTQWSLVFDISNSRIYFKTQQNENIRYVDLSAFDFSSASPVMYLDLDNKLSGDVSSRFLKYSPRANRIRLKNAIEKCQEFEGPVSPYVRKKMSKYPKTTKSLDRPFRKWLRKLPFFD